MIYQFLPPFLVVIIYGLRLKELYTKRDTIAGATKETLTLRLLKLVGLITVGSCLAEYYLLHRQFGWITVLTGSLMAVGSFAIRRRAIRALGKFWSLHVEIRDSHQFVRDDIFRCVRHPAYLSMFMEILSVGMILATPFALALALALFTPVILRRIHLEEAALVEKFGEAYREYQQSTPALLPKWPMS